MPAVSQADFRLRLRPRGRAPRPARLPEAAGQGGPGRSRRRTRERLLVATWNIANLGLQHRREKDHRLIAEILGWFDLIAIQEVNDDLDGLRGIQAQMPERLPRPLLRPRRKQRALRLPLRLAQGRASSRRWARSRCPPKELKDVKLPGVDSTFRASTATRTWLRSGPGACTLALANVHLYFGATTRRARRGWSAGASRPTASRAGPSCATEAPRPTPRNILALGDFNLPLGRRATPSTAR